MNKEQLKDKVIEALKEVYDPEMPVNVYDLGLIYEINLDEQNNLSIKMTLTNPNCPMAEDIPVIVKNSVKVIEGINDVEVNIVFEPEWDVNLMTDAAKLELGML
jgi:FeS assembly SUF system protein